MLKKWEVYFIEVIRGRKKGFLPEIIKIILKPFSLFYSFGLKIRKFLYKQGLIKTYRPSGSILISIGNIVAGGAGKTPLTLLIAQEFYHKTKIAILSRGYRSLAEKSEEPICLSKGDGPLRSALYCGDEPCLLVENLPKAIAFVGKNRSKSAQMASEKGAKLILIDDGMQHHKLERDFEVVILDSHDPFGQGHLLPRGMLRDEPESLSKADLIVLNHVDSSTTYQSIKDQVHAYSQAPVVGTKLKVERIVSFEGKAIGPIKGKKVGLFCSIAHPEYFEKTVAELGAQIIDRHIIPDHRSFDMSEMTQFAARCAENGAELLVCTEKDKVKLVGNLTGSLPVAWVKIKLEIIEDQENWEKFIAKVNQALNTLD